MIVLVLIGFATTALIAAVILKVSFKLTAKQAGVYTCIAGKTVIITGGNNGIGYYTALSFAMRGAKVILACRNAQRGEDAKRKIIEATRNGNIHVRIVDLASFDSIRTFCKGINETEEKIDILCNNAGILGSSKIMTDDGNVTIMQSNHLGSFLLTHLLIDKLRSTVPSRIVNLASLAAKRGKLKPENLNDYNKGGTHSSLIDTRVYSDSKQANILFTRLLGEKLKGTGITTYSVHPGVVYTNIFNEIGFMKYLMFVAKFFFITAEEGAQTSLYCSLAPELENETGKYYAECKEQSFFKTCSDMRLAERLWRSSEDLVKLRNHERI